MRDASPQLSAVEHSIPAPGLLLLAMIAFQLGAALAKDLFPLIGSGATVFLRLAVGALVLLLLWRPRLRTQTRTDYLLIGVFGLILAGMNAVFYASLARIPLGLAVTVEFVGPLGVAVAGSRRRLDLVWTLCAAGGILLLAPLGVQHVDPLGLALALLAGGLWAAYIMLARRVGRVVRGGSGMALAMSVGAVVLLPLGIPAAGIIVRSPAVLVTAAGIGVLSTALPYALEFAALQRLPARVYGVLVSGEPVIAALAGLVFLHETMGGRGWAALALVTIASLGAARSRDAVP